MIECGSGEILIKFDEIKGEIVSLLHKNNEYILNPVPAVEISVMDKSGERHKFTFHDFACKEALKAVDSFCVTYENDLICASLSAKIRNGIEWGLKYLFRPNIPWNGQIIRA